MFMPLAAPTAGFAIVLMAAGLSQEYVLATEFYRRLFYVCFRQALSDLDGPDVNVPIRLI